MDPRSVNPLRKIAQEHTTQKKPDTPEPVDVQAPVVGDAWRTRAACYDRSNEMFPRYHKDISYISVARAICRSCPVKNQCLDVALTFPVTDMHGVWGGLTPRQLAAEQKRRGITGVKPTIAQIWADFARIEKERMRTDYDD